MIVRYALNATGAPINAETAERPALWWEYDTEEQRGRWVRLDGSSYSSSYLRPYFYCVKNWVIVDDALQMDIGL